MQARPPVPMLAPEMATPIAHQAVGMTAMPLSSSFVKALARQRLAKAIVSVKEHESHTKEGTQYHVGAHPMRVDSKGIVAALASLKQQGHVQSYEQLPQAKAAAKVVKGSKIHALGDHYHVATPYGSRKLQEAGGPKPLKLKKPKPGEQPRPPKVNVQSPDHLIAAGTAMVQRLRQLKPGSAEHQHLLTQYNAVRESIQTWNRTKGESAATPAGGPIPHVGDPPEFLKGRNAKLRSPKSFEIAVQFAKTREQAMDLAHHYNAFTDHHGFSGPHWDAAWHEIKHAINTLPSEHGQAQQAIAAARVADHAERVQASGAAVDQARAAVDRHTRTKTQAEVKEKRVIENTKEVPPAAKKARAVKRGADTKLAGAQQQLAVAEQQHAATQAAHEQAATQAIPAATAPGKPPAGKSRGPGKGAAPVTATPAVGAPNPHDLSGAARLGPDPAMVAPAAPAAPAASAPVPPVATPRPSAQAAAVKPPSGRSPSPAPAAAGPMSYDDHIDAGNIHELNSVDAAVKYRDKYGLGDSHPHILADRNGHAYLANDAGKHALAVAGIHDKVDKKSQRQAAKPRTGEGDPYERGHALPMSSHEAIRAYREKHPESYDTHPHIMDDSYTNSHGKRVGKYIMASDEGKRWFMKNGFASPLEGDDVAAGAGADGQAPLEGPTGETRTPKPAPKQPRAPKATNPALAPTEESAAGGPPAHDPTVPPGGPGARPAPPEPPAAPAAAPGATVPPTPPGSQPATPSATPPGSQPATPSPTPPGSRPATPGAAPSSQPGGAPPAAPGSLPQQPPAPTPQPAPPAPKQPKKHPRHPKHGKGGQIGHTLREVIHGVMHEHETPREQGTRA